ncbi:MAG: class I SAM-dependent methyltransferase [Acidimicrobiia bacterium]
MTDAPISTPSFLAPPGEVADWRLVLLYDAAWATGLADALPATVADAADRAGLEPKAVRAVLDALVASGLATADADGTVTLVPAATDPATRSQLRQHASTIRRWSTSIEPRLRGEDAPLRSPFDLKGWLQSMAAGAAQQADAVADTVLAAVRTPPVEGRPRRALDIGGGHGRYAAALAARGLEVTMQDRPDVIATVEREGWLDGTGVHLVVGDVHDHLPDGPFDVVLAVGVLHTMPPERVASLLRRVGAIMAPGGGLLIRTQLRGEGAAAALFAVQMLVAGQGGDAHRLVDYQVWLADAGLTQPEVSTVGNGALLVSIKP